MLASTGVQRRPGADLEHGSLKCGGLEDSHKDGSCKDDGPKNLEVACFDCDWTSVILEM